MVIHYKKIFTVILLAMYGKVFSQSYSNVVQASSALNSLLKSKQAGSEQQAAEIILNAYNNFYFSGGEAQVTAMMKNYYRGYNNTSPFINAQFPWQVSPQQPLPVPQPIQPVPAPAEQPTPSPMPLPLPTPIPLPVSTTDLEELQKLQDKIGDLQKQIQQLEKEKKEAQKKGSQGGPTFRLDTDKLLGMDKQLSDAQKQIEKLKDDLQKANNKAAQTQQQCAADRQELNRLKGFEQKWEEKEAAAKKAAEDTQRVAGLEAELADYRKKLNDMTDFGIKTGRDLKTAKDELASLKTECSGLQQSSKATVAENKKLQTQLNEIQGDYEEKLAKQTKDIEKYKDAVVQLGNQLKTCSTNYGECEADLEVYKKGPQQTGVNWQSQYLQCTNDLTAKSKEANDLQVQVSLAQKETAKYQKIADDQKKAADTQIKGLKSDLAHYQQQAAEYGDKYGKLDKDCKSLKTKYDKLNTDYQKLDATYNKVIKDDASYFAQLSATKNTLARSNKKIMTEVKDLQEYIEDNKDALNKCNFTFYRYFKTSLDAIAQAEKDADIDELITVIDSHR